MLQEVWREGVGCGFQQVLVLWRGSGPCIAVGDATGQLQFFHLSHTPTGVQCVKKRSLDTKGGPVQAMAKRRGTRTAWKRAGGQAGGEGIDLVVADSQGNVSVFFVGQGVELLCRHTLRCAASAVCLDREMGAAGVYVGDRAGAVARIDDSIHLLPQPQPAAPQPEEDMSVTCMLVARITCAGGAGKYTFVGSGDGRVHVYSSALLLYSMQLPACATSMCAAMLDLGAGVEERVVVACANGCLYLLQGTSFQLLAAIGHCVTEVRPLAGKAGDGKAADSLFCTGHFDGIAIMQAGQPLEFFRMGDWVHSLDCGWVGGRQLVVAGLLSNQVVCLAVEST